MSRSLGWYASRLSRMSPARSAGGSATAATGPVGPAAGASRGDPAHPRTTHLGAFMFDSLCAVSFHEDTFQYSAADRLVAGDSLGARHSRPATSRTPTGSSTP